MTLPKVKPIFYVIGTQTLFIVILIAFVVFRKPVPVIKTQDNEKIMRDSINLLMKQYYVIEQDKLRLHVSFDSLQKLKTPTIQIYEKQIKNIGKAPVDSVADFIRNTLKGSN